MIMFNNGHQKLIYCAIMGFILARNLDTGLETLATILVVKYLFGDFENQKP